MHLDLTPKHIERFWSNVDRRGPDACWEWQRARHRNGYGTFSLRNVCPSGRKQFGAHQIAYLVTYGSYPDDLCVLHRCDNRACCNPGHLFLGTQRDNMVDMYSKGRANTPRGTQRGSVKLTEDQVREIRALYKPRTYGRGPYALARQFGVGKTCIADIVSGKKWSHLK